MPMILIFEFNLSTFGARFGKIQGPEINTSASICIELLLLNFRRGMKDGELAAGRIRNNTAQCRIMIDNSM